MDAMRALRIAGVSIVLFVVGFFFARGPARAPAPEPPPASPPPAAPAPSALPPAATGSPEAGPVSVPAGTGVIRGRVATDDGTPLPGVTVRAVPDEVGPWPDDPPLPPTGDPLVEEIRHERRQAERERRGTREATSGADGTFSLGGLAEQPYRLAGWRAGYEIEVVGDDHRPPGSEVLLLARPVVVVTVDVRMPDGSRPPRALVRVRAAGPRGHGLFTWTPEAMKIQVAPGLSAVTATAGEGEPLRSEAVEIPVAAGDRPAPVVLRLRERCGIRVPLYVPPAATRSSLPFRILALRVRPGAVPPPEALRTAHHAEATSYTSWNPAKGFARYTLPDLSPGTWLIGARSGSGEFAASAVVEVGAGMADVELDASAADGPAERAVRAFDPDGRPIPAEDLSVSRRTWKDGDGERRLLTVRADPWGTKTVEADPAAAEVAVRFEAPARLTVLLPGYPGSRYEGAAIVGLAGVPFPGARPEPFPPERRPDPRGRAVFDPVAPGEYELSLMIEGTNGAREVVLAAPIRVASGPREEVVSPPPLFTLDVDGADPGAAWRLESVAGGRWRAGPGRFERLPAGDYLLRGPAVDGFSGMPVRLAGDLRLRWRPVRLDALRVVLRDAGGALGRAGLRDGDLVTAVDGTEIDGGTPAWTLFARKDEESPVELTVLRDGARLAISLLPAAIRDPSAAGGALVPWVRGRT